MVARSIGTASLIRQLGPWRSATGAPAHRALADALRLLILDGRLPLTVRLPGERAVAQALGLSRTTVTAAFARLRDDGFLEGRRGAGAVTCLPQDRESAAHLVAPPSLQADLIDLGSASFPASEAVHGAYVRALEALPRHLPTHGYDGRGLIALREVIAARYTRDGLPTTPSEVLVTNGALSGLSLVLRALTRPGDRVVIDHPSYPHAIDAIQRAGCQPVPVPLPAGEGWDVEALGVAFRQNDAKLAYIIADFHNPTGRCMSTPDREAVAEAGRRAHTRVIFDETLRDLAFDGVAPPISGPAEQDTIRLGSMGKSFWGGLRVGWVRADGEVIARLLAARPSLDLGTPVLEQLAAAALLESEAGLVRRREQLRDQRDALLNLLGEYMPAWRAPSPAGGVSLWVQLPRPLSGPLVSAAEQHGVRLVAGPRFGVGGSFQRFVRLPFTQPVAVLEAAARRLRDAYSSLAHARASSWDDGPEADPVI